MKSKGLASFIAQESLRTRFTDAGLAPDRLDFRSFEATRQGHLAAYHAIDIALDTTPYCGTTTTCEALWMGVPLVSLRGSTHAGRVGQSLLNAVGMPELAASSEAEFIAVASSIAADPTRRAAIRTGLRERVAASELCDGAALGRALDDAFASMWAAWCAANP